MTTKTMKNILTILIVLFSVLNISGQDKKFLDTYFYYGHVFTEQDTKLDISLNFLILSDSTITGIIFYKEPKWVTHNLSGRLLENNTFCLTEHSKSDSLIGYIIGNFSDNFISAKCKFLDDKKGNGVDFVINRKTEIFYYDYISKNRYLYEYSSLRKATKEKSNVLSIDVASQGLNKLPKKLSRLDKIVSINLLGNQFECFPTVLSKLSTLDEISLSSNRLKYVGPEIGNLKNLRILIMNNNQLTELPKEIGKLTNLLYLEIGNNQLTSLPEEIKYLTSLQVLHIERNKLSDMEKERIKKLLPKCEIHF